MVDEPGLLGVWTHAHEEDHGEVQVYRPQGFRLPPARGRSSFTLLPDGLAATGVPGPDDRGRTSDGHWSLDGSLLTLSTGGNTAAYDVVAVAPDRLELRSVPPPATTIGPAEPDLPVPTDIRSST